MIHSKIEEAEIILVGLGEEFEENNICKNSAVYEQGRDFLEKHDMQWLFPAWREYFVSHSQSRVREALEHLLKLLEGKNYFVVSTCIDSRIRNAAWKYGRIVMPCGDNAKTQCVDGCEDAIQELTELQRDSLTGLFEKLYSGEAADCEAECIEIQGLSRCDCCGKGRVLNNIYCEHYCEAGYLEQWSLYLKWLQGTVNRRLLVLELGVSMKFPSVIRWPFEKTVFFNQKAELVRVNESIYQMTEELAEKGTGIQKNAIEWLLDL